MTSSCTATLASQPVNFKREPGTLNGLYFFKEIPFCTRYVMCLCASTVCITKGIFCCLLSHDGAAKGAMAAATEKIIFHFPKVSYSPTKYFFFIPF